MKAIIQRVNEASVKIDQEIYASINQGLLVFIGIESGDTNDDGDWLVSKISQLRIFSDENEKMNLSLIDKSWQILIISQFTLIADTRKGNRPSFIRAAKGQEAISLYEAFVEKFSTLLEKPCTISEPGNPVSNQPMRKVFTGIFGADMQVSLINNGPVTIEIDTRNKN